MPNPTDIDPERRQPAFLATLDTDPERAGRLFDQCARDLLRRNPTPSLRAMSRFEKRADLVTAFVSAAFYKLPKYKDRAKDFEGWLWVVAESWFRDLLRKKRRQDRYVVAADDLPRPVDAPSPTQDHPDPAPDTLTRLVNRTDLDQLRQCLHKLPLESRIIILGRLLDGLSFPEIALLLGRPRTDNQAIADKLSKVCLPRLRNCIRQQRSTTKGDPHD